MTVCRVWRSRGVPSDKEKVQRDLSSYAATAWVEEGERAAWVMRDLKGDEVEVGEDEAEVWYS